MIRTWISTQALVWRTMLVAIAVSTAPTRAWAWSECGHHIIAIMAFEQLDASRQAELIRILREHPRFAADFVAPSGTTTENHWLIGRAGYWPDVARRSSFDRSTWHYQLGATDVIGTVANVPDFPLDLPAGATLDTQDLYIAQAIELCRGVFHDPDETASNKALALCWLCHLVGDAHQPCHAGSLYVEGVFPEGDRGANSIPTRQGRNMHALWDGLLGRAYDAGDIRRRIAEIQELSRMYSSTGLTPTARGPVNDWLGESRASARAYVYASEVMEPITVAMRSGSTDVAQIDLSDEYLQAAGRLAQIRAWQASVRLATVLSAPPPS